jgi:cytochrome d ubiquinol oxidase subunit II
MIADVAGGILLAGLTLYAALGGADFGGGLWDLLAGGDQRGQGPRQLIDDTITPVWEANHVWLIFVLVIFWTAFPAAFAAVMTAAALPLWLAAFGIVLRGSGFAFRKEVEALGWQRLFGFGFAFSSLIVPFFMGTVIGAIASGRVPASLAHTDLAVWTGPTSLLIGALFVAVCGYLAAVFLTREASRRSDDRLRRYFARRAAAAGAVSGALSLATLLEIRSSRPALYHGLTHRALPLVIVSAACGLAVLVSLATGRSQALRPLSVLGVAAVVWGWGVAQYPVLLPGTSLTLTTGAAPHSILVTVVVVFVAAAVLVGPSFLLLFSLHGRQLLEPENRVTSGPAGGDDEPRRPA